MQGQLRSLTRCPHPHCGHASEAFDPYMPLSLPIPLRPRPASTKVRMYASVCGCVGVWVCVRAGVGLRVGVGVFVCRLPFHARSSPFAAVVVDCDKMYDVRLSPLQHRCIHGFMHTYIHPSTPPNPSSTQRNKPTPHNKDEEEEDDDLGGEYGGDDNVWRITVHAAKAAVASAASSDSSVVFPRKCVPILLLIESRSRYVHVPIPFPPFAPTSAMHHTSITPICIRK